MTSIHEQIATTTQATLGNQIAMCDAISKLAFHGIEKIVAFNMSAAKDSLDNVKNSSQQLFSMKKPGDLFAYSAEKPQPSIEKFIAFGRELALISTDMHNEVLQTMRLMSPLQTLESAHLPSFTASFSASDFQFPSFSFLTTLLKPSEDQSSVQTVVYKDIPRAPNANAMAPTKEKTAPKKAKTSTPVKSALAPSTKPAAKIAAKPTPKNQVKAITKTPPKPFEKKANAPQSKQLPLITETPTIPATRVKAKPATKASPSKATPVVTAKPTPAVVKKASNAKATAPSKKPTTPEVAKEAPVIAVQNGIVTASKATPAVAPTTPPKNSVKPSFPTVVRKSPTSKAKTTE